ncbi:MAG: alanine racemase [Microbacteriaceae bacterium]
MTLLAQRTRALATRTIDHAAIARNVEHLADITRVAVMAVVKADAFGHGSIEVARTALSAGATWIGVATVEEALELRQAGIPAPIFAWLVDQWCDLRAAVAADVTLSCANVETLRAIEEAAASLGLRVDVHLELDTGMARGGSTPELWADLCAVAALHPRVRVTGIWSHLALAELPGEENVALQIWALERGERVARAAGHAPRHVHLANSAGALHHSSTRLTMVRVGAAVYGIGDLEPAMRLTSRIVQLRQVPAGTGVGYAHTFRTTDATTLALVPVGYGDGVPRNLAGSVAVAGVRCPIRGRISMDQFTIEVTSDARIGDNVVLLGDPRVGEPSVEEWATAAGTIAHEIYTGLGARVTRVHA